MIYRLYVRQLLFFLLLFVKVSFVGDYLPWAVIFLSATGRKVRQTYKSARRTHSLRAQPPPIYGRFRRPHQKLEGLMVSGADKILTYQHNRLCTWKGK